MVIDEDRDIGAAVVHAGSYGYIHRRRLPFRNAGKRRRNDVGASAGGRRANAEITGIGVHRTVAEEAPVVKPLVGSYSGFAVNTAGRIVVI